MTPVDQRLIDPGIGDCLTCCVAAILGLPYEDVPQFNRVAAESGGKLSWFHVVWDFAAARRLDFWCLSVRDYLEPWEGRWTKPRYAIACGKSPRGTHRHAVVWEWGKGVVFDPHPSRLGLDGPPTDYMVILPQRPA